MKNIGILIDTNNPLQKTFEYALKDFNTEFFDEVPQKEFDIFVNAKKNSTFSGKAICCKHSLLPAFDSDEPLRDAILYGAKITGITIYQQEPFKIFAQYPAFITNDKHYDDLILELDYLEQTFFPIVVKKLALNEPFEIKDYLKKNNCSSGGCSSCGGCS